MGRKKKGPRNIKALTEAQKETIENAWYQFDTDGSDTLDFSEVLTIMQVMSGEVTEEEAKEMYAAMDEDGDRKVSFTEYMSHMEKLLKKHPLAAVEEKLSKLCSGPPGSNEWIKRDARSEEEQQALKGLQGVRYLLKPEMLEDLRRQREVPKGVQAVCVAAMCMLNMGHKDSDWHSCQQWLRGGDDLVFKLSGFNKRVDVGQVADKYIITVRQLIVDNPEAFRADKIETMVAGEAGKAAMQIANWVLISVRYFDAVKSNMKMTLQNQAPGGIDGPSFAAAKLPVRTAIPKALESFHVHKVPLLYDPGSLAATFLKYNKSKILDAVDPRHLFKGPLHKALCHCLEYGVPLVIDLNTIADDSVDVPARFNDVQAGLWDDLLLHGKGKDPALLSQLMGEEVSLKNPDSFGVFIISKVERVPCWISEEGYVTIEVK